MLVDRLSFPLLFWGIGRALDNFYQILMFRFLLTCLYKNYHFLLFEMHYIFLDQQ